MGGQALLPTSVDGWDPPGGWSKEAWLGRGRCIFAYVWTPFFFLSLDVYALMHCASICFLLHLLTFCFVFFYTFWTVFILFSNPPPLAPLPPSVRWSPGLGVLVPLVLTWGGGGVLVPRLGELNFSVLLAFFLSVFGEMGVSNGRFYSLKKWGHGWCKILWGFRVCVNWRYNSAVPPWCIFTPCFGGLNGIFEHICSRRAFCPLVPRTAEPMPARCCFVCVLKFELCLNVAGIFLSRSCVA